VSGGDMGKVYRLQLLVIANAVRALRKLWGTVLSNLKLRIRNVARGKRLRNTPMIEH